MTLLKKCLPDVLAVLLFAVLAFAYFFPADIEGRILYRHDASAGRGAGQEGIEYLQKTGERSRWTNALFGGMPTYQMAPSYGSTNLLTKAVDAYHLWLPENVWFVFAYLLGFYILLRAFDFRQHLAALGSIIWAFSTYFLIIIAAGHIWKVWALAYLPPMIAGLVLAYKGRYLWGLLLTAIFTAFEINANHVQMTYYYLFIILFLVIAWLVEAIQQKQLLRFAKATAVCIAGAAIGVCINLSNLYHTWQYSQESMRGKSELVKQNSENQTSSGLERDYITQWSYGIDETWTLLVPNTKGGASMPLTPILGRTAWHIGTCICRSLCDDALHSWSFHRKGTCEMGIAGSYDSLDPALMGQELHGLYRLLPRLRTHVCKVPNGGFHPGDCRVHHPLTGHAGAEETA